MWISIVLFTMGTAAVSAQQFAYWRKHGQAAERWVSFSWMLTAWVIGIVLLAGVKFPTPTKPLFPSWK